MVFWCCGFMAANSTIMSGHNTITPQYHTTNIIMKKSLLTVCACWLWSVVGITQTQMTLQEAIAYAFENNLEIKKAQLDVADADAQIFERRSSGLPSLTADVNYNHFLQVPVSTLPDAFQELIRLGNMGELPPDFSPQVAFQLRNIFSAGLNLRTMIFDGSFFTALKAAKTFKDFALEDLEARKEEVKNQVVEAYLPALILKENQILIEKNIKNIEALYYGTKRTYEEGFIEQLDVDRLELTLANLNTEKDNLYRQEEQVMNFLKLAIGFPANEELVAIDDIEALLIPASKQDLTSVNSYLHRKAYRVAEAGLELSKLNIEYNKNLYWPSLAFNAGYNQTYQGDKLFGDPNSFWAPTFVVGLGLRVPILDGFGKDSKIERQQIAYEMAKTQRDQLRQLIDIEILNGRKQYQGATERLENQKKNLTLAEKIYNTTQIKYKEGVGTSLELSNAERDLFATQRNYTQALYDVLVAKMNLDKVLGK